MAENELLARFDKCPNCGSEKRLMGEIVKEQKEKGKLEGMSPCLMLLQSVAGSPKDIMTGLLGSTIPVGIGILDACMDCGTVYTVEQQEAEVPIERLQQEQGRQQMPNLGDLAKFLGGAS